MLCVIILLDPVSHFKLKTTMKNNTLIPPRITRKDRQEQPKPKEPNGKITCLNAPKNKIIRKKSSLSTKKKPQSLSNNTLFLLFLFAILLLIVIQVFFGANFHLIKTDNSFHSKIDDFKQDRFSITSKDEGDLEHFIKSEMVKTSNLQSNLKINPDKEPIRKLLERAGVEVTPAIYAKLPSYSDITATYGSDVKIHGLETCQEFRDTVPGKERMLGVAGMFNTGTNLLTQLLLNNCYIEDKVKEYGPKYHGIRVQVPWGKHSPPYFRLNHQAKKGANGVNHEYVLPAVMIKDPYTWMGSLCRHHYAALWKHTTLHCPNLVANENDKLTQNGKVVPAIIKYSPTNITTHESIAGIWNDWNNDYMHYHNTQPFPRLIIRFEDVLFQTEKTVTQICQCAGGKVYDQNKFYYIEKSAKDGQDAHKGAQGLLQAIMFYGNVTNRLLGFDEGDLKYARRYLDQELMDVFSYNVI